MLSKRRKIREQLALTIFHLHFSSHLVLWPSRNYWRVATIIPLLKAGKLASEVASFHPISLTSCVAKLLEHILADRLYYIAETNNMFSRFQAGFHKGRSCEDQITRIVQTIEDGFQQRPMKHSVLTFPDFCKAQYTVWREKLLLHMLNTGIPSTFIRWICSFLNDRRGRVQLFNVFNSSRRFTQGLPQSSALAPLLFLFCINDLASTLNDDAVIALFANDVSILTTACKKENTKAAAQSAVNSVVTWSQEWKLNLNAEKREVCLFSAWSMTSPRIQLSLLAIRKFVSTPLLRIIRATAHISRGWPHFTLKMAFHALVCSKLDYAAPAWQPWLSDTNLSSLDRLKNHSLRLITGQLVSTPLEALRLEADVQS